MKSNSKSSFSPLLHLTYVLQQLSDDNLLHNVGVGLSQTRIMSALSSAAPRSQSQIASQLQQTEANVSRQLHVMKKRGLVSITRHKKDARLREVRLTSKGARAYAKAVKILAAQQKDFFKLLDKKEIKSFNRGAENLLKALDIMTGERRLLG